MKRRCKPLQPTMRDKSDCVSVDEADSSQLKQDHNDYDKKLVVL